ncbi:ABC transporter substrate-binding protein [uncultured Alsobacter sp.]|uniref:ABC transporter substrate-binding protein n=1 Tax=uncultured Alsobacter sp. TaxID=1748258 RepID=UPI0025F8147E|nr:ABC transporter substrate-binding protein [uncultured Alsobacter sp.]
MITIRTIASRAVLGGLAATLMAGTALAQASQCGRKGGDLTFALEARVPGLDQHASNSSATRNVAMNMFETLVTRDENMIPVLELAESMDQSADGLTYTFKLRQGITFHNGKAMTSADVAASFQRYSKIGVDRSILEPVDKWETPDANTFVLKLKEARPTFIEQLSAFTVPVVIIPAENVDAAAGQLPVVGTGPFQLDEFKPDSHVKLKRFAGYKPDTRHTAISGFGGNKEACLDTVTFRMMTEPAARTAALEVGEIQGVEDVPVASQKRLAGSKDIKLTRLELFTMNVAYPNASFPPTDNPKVRQAILAAMDFEEIMDAASDGQYKLNKGFQFPGMNYYSESGAENLNQKNKDKAKKLLAEAGYKGEKVTLLTNREFPYMYNTSLVMAEQLKAAGINAELLVLDWPAALQKSIKETEGWNFFYTGWITVIALGGPQTMRQMAAPNYVWKPKEPDAEFQAAFQTLAGGKTLDERKAAFAKAQARALDQVMAIPFGAMPKTQAVRANVEGFKAYYIPRMSGVWLKS